MNQYVDEDFLLEVVNYKCKLAEQLKKLYKVTTIFSSTFFDNDIPLPTPGASF